MCPSLDFQFQQTYVVFKLNLFSILLIIHIFRLQFHRLSSLCAEYHIDEYGARSRSFTRNCKCQNAEVSAWWPHYQLNSSCFVKTSHFWQFYMLTTQLRGFLYYRVKSTLYKPSGWIGGITKNFLMSFVRYKEMWQLFDEKRQSN